MFISGTGLPRLSQIKGHCFSAVRSWIFSNRFGYGSVLDKNCGFSFDFKTITELLIVCGVSEIKPLVNLQNLEVSVSVRFWIKTSVSVSISKLSQH